MFLFTICLFLFQNKIVEQHPSLDCLAKIHRVEMIDAAGKYVQRKTISLSDVTYVTILLLAIEFAIKIK